MHQDPALRVLLGLILACLLILVAQGFGLGADPGGQGRYRVSVIKNRKPWLMRFDTVTGRVEQFRMKGDRRWVALGEADTERGGDAERERGQQAALEVGKQQVAAARPETPIPREPPGSATALPREPGAEIAALADALQPGQPREIRIWAAELIGTYGADAPNVSVPLLTGVLEDPDAAVVAAAVRSLGASRSPDALAAVRGLLGHPDAEVQAAARQALVALE